MIQQLANFEVQDRTRDEWLAERLSIVGASESPAIVGAGYGNENAFTVWGRKTGVLPELDDCEAFEWGREMQPVVLRMFEKKTGIKPRSLGDYTILRHARYPWMGATLDAIADTDEGPAVIEVKNVGQYNFADWKDEEPPLRVSVQLQHQMAVADVGVGYATACIGGRSLRWIKMYRDDRFVQAMIGKLEAFWECVESKTPPAIDGSAATAEVLKLMHPEDNGQTIDLPDECARFFEDWELAKQQVKAAEASVDLAKNRLVAAIGDNSFGRLPTGQYLSLLSQTNAAHYREESTFRVLRATKKNTT